MKGKPKYTCQGCLRIFPIDEIEFYSYEPIKVHAVSINSVPIGKPLMQTHPKKIPFCHKCYTEYESKSSTKLKNIGRFFLNH